MIANGYVSNISISAQFCNFICSKIFHSFVSSPKFRCKCFSRCSTMAQMFYHGLNLFDTNVPFVSLREKCMYLELFWSVFSRIRNEYEEILHIFGYSVRMRKIWTRITPNKATFYAVFIPWKRPKTKDFLKFSVGIDKEHLCEVG